MRKINLKGEEIDYELKESKRSSRVRLSVFYGGKVAVTMPRGFSIEKMEKFILEKAEWVLEKIKTMEEKDFNPVFHNFSKREYKEFKNQALILAERKTEELNKYYGFSYNKISVRNSRSRWGSCSEKKNLNFNYKIIFLPEGLLNYIIIHELCHLREMNHSKRFWNLVEKTVPDYKEMRKKMRRL